MKKEKLYQEFPQLANIDKKINSLALSSMKEIALNSDTELLSRFNEQMSLLKKEKRKYFNFYWFQRANSILPHYECPHCQDTGYISQDIKLKCVTV